MTTLQEKLFDVLIAPIVTERTTSLAELNKVVFKVKPEAEKPLIKKAVEELFKVKVRSVNTITVHGKTKRFKGRVGVRSDYKKAIVTLEAGQTINLSAGA